MEWLFFLIVATGMGTGAMALLISAGVDVWVSRGVGALVAALVGVITCYISKRKKNCEKK